ncbi:hypothetical protein [Cohaesibacter intestini]|uniref:hypothetical protein n=1 Tax=Cohaesibacter intestini TaxID=2211145 RepID=UPI000DE99C77|nr:hypothetical protein [Cohaesibacter intestini]
MTNHHHSFNNSSLSLYHTVKYDQAEIARADETQALAMMMAYEVGEITYKVTKQTDKTSDRIIAQTERFEGMVENCAMPDKAFHHVATALLETIVDMPVEPQDRAQHEIATYKLPSVPKAT